MSGGRHGMRWRPGAAVASLAVLALLAGCTGAPAPAGSPSRASPSPAPSTGPAPSGDGELRLGVLVPRAGTREFLAAPIAAGVRLAARDLGRAGGQAPRVVVRSTGDGGEDDLAEAIDALAEAGVDAIVGPATSRVAQRALPLAAARGIPLVSPSATLPVAPDEATGWILHRTVATLAQQGPALAAQLLAEGDVESVAVVAGEDAESRSLLAPLRQPLEAAGVRVEVLDAPQRGRGAAAVARRAADLRPDAVVVATQDGDGEVTAALVRALHARRLAGERLWLTATNAGDLSRRLEDGEAAGVRAVLDGVRLPRAVERRLRQVDADLASARYAAEAYDAAVLIGLAAAVAGDDGGESIAGALPGVAAGGIRCGDPAECLGVLAAGSDPDYDGLAGSLAAGADGILLDPRLTLVRYREDGTWRPIGDAVAG
ncbi:ABC transporter substrate-binding protein [Homoserinibacter sp. YIM 151385]|uniref:ABC transporter substrate-binding protein n=1 Tax=Homoserinibacter sp. YIM 151385 TaxID=2985506 RepID=UPI0022F10FF1|nr:ABC transporter substrate-binding protein [Homoserinibacter sp. YIM 151385]WBU37721.1 ABC transporter substrate-binding protein [Homoserinibacter sp. YIM 151385]